VWGGGDACVAGSNEFYGEKKVKRDGGVKRVQGIRRDIDVEEVRRGLGVHTGEGVVLGGDSIMLP
jgi:hypothetical protein